jgi:CHAD domain-containing protein
MVSNAPAAGQGGKLLSRVAVVAAALLGLMLLDAVRESSERLADADDAEALHDFRVALRRLRTLLRTFREELGDAASKKLQRRLRGLTRMTSGGRDAEVQLAWVRARRGQIARGSRAGLAWLVARLTARRDETYAVAQDDVAPELRQVERRERRALIEVTVTAAPHGALFAAAAARVVRAEAAALNHALAAARSPHDQEAVHAARIVVKRLRYLLEWLAGEVPQATPIIARLRGLQDVLGELHDLHVFIGELGDAVADAAAEHARSLHARAMRSSRGPAPRRRRAPAPRSAGLLSLARLASDEEERLGQRLTAELDTAGTRALEPDLMTLADDLVTAPPAPPKRSPRRLRLGHGGRAAV